MNTKEKMQYMANGIILACSHFVSDMAVSKDNVINTLGLTGITKEEWDKCDDEISKNIILEKLDGKLSWIEDDKQ